jgi:hypothetical protein
LVGIGLLLVSTAHSLAHPAQVIIIRHAEKPAKGNGLSLRGEERAAALVPYFRKSEELVQFKAPVAIYAQRASTPTASRRAIETVKPLADCLELQVNDSYMRDDYKSMVDEIMNSKDYEGRTVLICWEHKIIPKIAAQLGAKDAPTNWPDSEYDRTWIIIFQPGESPHCKIVLQQLMYGDGDK